MALPPLHQANDPLAPPESSQEQGPSASSQQRPGYGYGYGAPPAPSGLEPGHLLDYVRVVYRHRWIAIAAFLVVALGATAYTYTRVPQYQSSARLLLLSQRESFGLKNASAFESTNYLQTQYALLSSRWVAKHAMRQLGLLKVPPADGAAPQAGDESPSAAIASLTQEAPDEVAGITGFLGGLRIVPVGGSGLVDVVYSSTDAATTAERANAIASAYVQQTIELRSRASKEASGWLVELLAEQRQKVQNAEQALQRYREQNNVVEIDERSSPVLQNLTELSVAVTRARTERIEKESIYRRIKAIENDPDALESSPIVLADPQVQQLRNEVTALDRRYAELAAKLGERHPDLIKTRDSLQAAEGRLQARARRVVDSAYADLQAAQAAETSVGSVFNAQKQQAFATNRGGVELSVLSRDLESNRQIYDGLTRQARELDISGEIRMNTALVLESARVPASPVFPNTAKDLQYGVLGGLVLGLGLAFLFEYLDSRLKSPDEVKKHLGLVSLGFVPAVSPKLLRSQDPTTEPGTQGLVEAFRTIRTNIIFSSTQPGMQTLVVTSTNPAEGKTVVASNLAIAMAQAGQRVLLIDGDMRRARVHEVFDLKQEPGLSNLLVGASKPADALKTCRVPGLRILAAGRVPPNPSELLGSKRFKELLHALRDHFDWVLIDTPPVMVTSDASIAAHLANGVIFVISASATSRHAAHAALEQLHAVKANVLGSVLNKVDLERHGYYYAKYYRKDYAKYYRTSANS